MLHPHDAPKLCYHTHTLIIYFWAPPELGQLALNYFSSSLWFVSDLSVFFLRMKYFLSNWKMKRNQIDWQKNYSRFWSRQIKFSHNGEASASYELGRWRLSKVSGLERIDFGSLNFHEEPCQAQLDIIGKSRLRKSINFSMKRKSSNDDSPLRCLNVGVAIKRKKKIIVKAQWLFFAIEIVSFSCSQQNAPKSNFRLIVLKSIIHLDR